mmetsp:Transcript_42414/g.76108  ORF Transcript_42414/g.76108 Transcript_42414/m.76108 type:complete len:271 (+) Transcript_42414:800-1612(+)
MLTSRQPSVVFLDMACKASTSERTRARPCPRINSLLARVSAPRRIASSISLDTAPPTPLPYTIHTRPRNTCRMGPEFTWLRSLSSQPSVSHTCQPSPSPGPRRQKCCPSVQEGGKGNTWPSMTTMDGRGVSNFGTWQIETRRTFAVDSTNCLGSAAETSIQACTNGERTCRMVMPPLVDPPVPMCRTRHVDGSGGLLAAPPARVALKKRIMGSPLMIDPNQCPSPSTSLSCAAPRRPASWSSRRTIRRRFQGLTSSSSCPMRARKGRPAR